MSFHLDIGCGDKPRNPYCKEQIFGVDVNFPNSNSENFRYANLFIEKIPFTSNYFDSVSAYDFIEHIPRVLIYGEKNLVRFSFVELMNEVWRVLKPGGLFFSSTPFFPNPEIFVDPTHVNFITDKTHLYFCGSSPLGKNYGFNGNFKLIQLKKWKPREHYPFERISYSSAFRNLKDIIKCRRSHIVWELEAIKE